MIDINQILSYGGTFVGGGIAGAVMGFALKKIIKIALVIVGAIFALLAYLQYQNIIDVHWRVVENQASNFAQQSAQNLLHIINNTAQQMQSQGVGGIDIGFPIAGIIGFPLGFAWGFHKG